MLLTHHAALLNLPMKTSMNVLHVKACWKASILLKDLKVDVTMASSLSHDQETTLIIQRLVSINQLRRSSKVEESLRNNQLRSQYAIQVILNWKDQALNIWTTLANANP